VVTYLARNGFGTEEHLLENMSKDAMLYYYEKCHEQQMKELAQSMNANRTAYHANKQDFKKAYNKLSDLKKDAQATPNKFMQMLGGVQSGSGDKDRS